MRMWHYAKEDSGGGEAPEPTLPAEVLAASAAIMNTDVAEPEDTEEEAAEEPAEEAAEEEQTEAGVEETPPEADTEPDDAETDGFDEALLKHAESHGLYAKDFGTPENARAALARLDNKLIELSRGQQQPQEQPEPEKETPPAKVQQAPQVATFDLEKAISEVEDDIDEEVVGILKKMHEHYEGQNAALQQNVNQVNESFRVQAERAALKMFDDFLEDNSLKGELDNEEMNTVFVSSIMLAQQLVQMGQNDTPEAEVFKRAMWANFPEKMKQLDNAKVKEQATKRKKMVTTPPNTRSRTSRISAKPEKTGKEAAEDFLTQKFAELGGTERLMSG